MDARRLEVGDTIELDSVKLVRELVERRYAVPAPLPVNGSERATHAGPAQH